MLFVGLNPSTATAAKDDPTIRRCVGFAIQWGFDWYLMGNLYAYRSTDPKVLPTVPDPIGPENIDHLRWMAQKSELVIAAWGMNKLNRDAKVEADWLMGLARARCLGTNKDGSPKHPLYLPKDTAVRPLASL